MRNDAKCLNKVCGQDAEFSVEAGVVTSFDFRL